jgi:hypothetical protein
VINEAMGLIPFRQKEQRAPGKSNRHESGSQTERPNRPGKLASGTVTVTTVPMVAREASDKAGKPRRKEPV